MRQSRRLWQHGNMKEATPGDNQPNLWDEQAIAARTGRQSRQARREIRRGQRKNSRRGKR